MVNVCTGVSHEWYYCFLEHDPETSAPMNAFFQDWLHTRDGGERTLTLHNKKTVPLVLAPRSTVVLDAQTGAVLF